MKMDRLLNMIVVLLNRRRVQAKDLADLFGVSVRTVYRDMETISQAGIPLITYQGLNGGIGIADGYRLNQTVMTEDDWASVMTALKSLSSSATHTNVRTVLEKVKSVLPAHGEASFRVKSDSVLIDFGSWGPDPMLEEKVGLLKKAIESSQLAAFQYSSAKRETTERRVEPYTLILKGDSWYLYGYSLEREAFRLFKCSRMRDVQVLPEAYARREMNPEDRPWIKEWSGSGAVASVVMRLAPELRTEAEDRFGVAHVAEGADGTCTVRFTYPEDEWLYGFLLSFGPKAEVLEPLRVRDILRERAQQIVELYRG